MEREIPVLVAQRGFPARQCAHGPKSLRSVTSQARPFDRSMGARADANKRTRDHVNATGSEK